MGPRPRLKKPTLDPAELTSYRPISNLSFISKTVERVVAARFSEHMEAEHLLPSHQSAYRAHYSTETAIAAVHDELVSAKSVLAKFRSSYCSILAQLSIRSTTKYCWKFLIDVSVSSAGLVRFLLGKLNTDIPA